MIGPDPIINTFLTSSLFAITDSKMFFIIIIIGYYYYFFAGYFWQSIERVRRCVKLKEGKKYKLN